MKSTEGGLTTSKAEVETEAQGYRRTATNANENSYMETMENGRKAILGIAKTRSTGVDDKAIAVIWKPLSSGSQNNGIAPH